MAGEWQTVPLGSIATIKSGKRLPMGHTLTSQRTQHPYIRLVDVHDHRIRSGNMQYLKDNTQKAISKYIVRSGDVCLAIVGHTIGLVFTVGKHWDGANLTENAARLTDFRGADAGFVFNCLRSPNGQALIRSRTVGSAQGKLPLYAIAELPITLPPLSEQEAIAQILGSLDDKIDLNRRMNETLEAMARAIFKSWFVDFDPVRAKM
ncbi:MAG: restriction endonuclease subunit S [Isosphaeraceae bacterium]